VSKTMMKHLKITAISLILAAAGTTAASAQTDARPAASPYSYDSGPYAAYANRYPGFGRSTDCNNGLNDAVNGGRSPSMRYPIPGRCINE
jgi:hypothetical protein